ncbi:hypothetical protein Naga_100628g5 [Nannochloropsis gaditana]|uniref:Uncharacterized protein n=1 Tax=Nannochloropsis gaditana TaxID=72520 RepID=W7TW23_9STRA|nr:hypothetical protein Naga_100628g5 [Nannochloropsis gaditana]
MMILREHEISDRSLYHDALIANVSCHGLRPPNHLYVILLYDNRTGVDQCLWLSVVLVILVRDSWVNRWSTFSGRIVVVLKNKLGIGLLPWQFWFVYSHHVMGPN